MGKLDQVIQKLRSIDANRLLDEAIEKNKDEIVTLNQEQLDVGLKSSGASMPEYSNASPKTGKIRLYDTGDFWEGFFVRDKSDAFEISSTDKKTGMLVDRYGEDIFGLVSRQKQELARIIKKDFVISLKKLLK